MSEFDADARLRRALAGSAHRAGLLVTVTRSEATRWSSATFNGARHEVALVAETGHAVERWLGELPEADLPIVGHLVADLKIVSVRRDQAELIAVLEVLTVEDR